MKSSLVLCALLAVGISVRAASVPPSVEAVTLTTQFPTTHTVTGLYNDTTTVEMQTTSTTFPCCATSTTTTTTPYIRTEAPLTPSQMCHEGWEVYQGRCYYFVNDAMLWPQALLNCALLDSTLVSVHSAQEHGFLQHLTNSNGKYFAWLGGFYLQGEWLWLDGSWFYKNTVIDVTWESSNPCLALNIEEGWTNSPCNMGGYPSICVKASNVTPTMLCPEGWTGYQGRCYYYNDDSLTWHEADATCAGLEATLVSVHSPQEYNFLYQQTTNNGNSPTWLGGFYLMDQWMWLDGSWFYPGFFAETSFPQSANPCLSTLNSEGWSNYDCDQSFPSFCVKDMVV
ncbi:C-type mannose receptor 2-like [Plectropomus leopardus]|uniref:C-type mannose receptor 2-like n=1 Tax=Plectropomus leopardus TaxID=160734 RepID=UPI001C4AA73F|nr:C-type mannose receptor 2-like [Plectropomus leopardus]XP_042340827.1 C-type mannose receptor 2-like [Plectropomus leopardus]